MAGAFDPYYTWLGIPPTEQPPNHYRLLGVVLFEPDLQVIEHAADRQMGFLRTFQAGQHSAASQKILNEIAAAKICLLTPARRAEYDAQLKAALEPKAPAAAPNPVPVARPAVQPVQPRPATAHQPPVAPQPAPPARPAQDAGVNFNDFLSEPATGSPRASRVKKRRSALPWIGAAAVMFGLVVISGIFFFGSGEEKRPPEVARKVDPPAVKPKPAPAVVDPPAPPPKNVDPQPAPSAPQPPTPAPQPAHVPEPVAPPLERVEVEPVKTVDGSIDLLATLKKSGAPIISDWKWDQGSLVTGDPRPWQLQYLPADVPIANGTESYILEAVVERTAQPLGDDRLVFALPYKREWADFMIDSFASAGFGVFEADKKYASITNAIAPGILVPLNLKRKFVFVVEPTNVTVFVDGQRLDAEIKVAGHRESPRSAHRIGIGKCRSIAFHEMRLSEFSSERRDIATRPTRPPFSPTIGRPGDARRDLLSLIKPERDAFYGQWRFDGSKLVSEGDMNQWRIVEIPYKPVGPYQLTLKATGVSRAQVVMGLMADHGQFTAGWGQLTGIAMQRDLLHPSWNLLHVPSQETERNLPFEKDVTLVYVVQGDQMWFTCNGRPVAVVSKFLGNAIVSRYLTRPATDRMFLGCRGNPFVVHELTIQSLPEPLPVPDAPAEFQSPTTLEDLKTGKPAVAKVPPVPPQPGIPVGVERSMKANMMAMLRGVRLAPPWRFEGSDLVHDDTSDAQQQRLPIDVLFRDGAESYMIEATIERRAADETENSYLLFGLPYKNTWTDLIIDFEGKATGFGLHEAGEITQMQSPRVNEHLLPRGEKHAFVIAVNANGIGVQCDGKPLKWSSEVRAGERRVRRAPRQVYFAASKAFAISKLDISSTGRPAERVAPAENPVARPAPEPVPPKAPPVPPDEAPRPAPAPPIAKPGKPVKEVAGAIDLLAALRQSGERLAQPWTWQGDSLVHDEAEDKQWQSLPVEVPMVNNMESYVLEAVVERRAVDSYPRGALMFALPFNRLWCDLMIDMKYDHWSSGFGVHEHNDSTYMSGDQVLGQILPMEAQRKLVIVVDPTAVRVFCDGQPLNLPNVSRAGVRTQPRMPGRIAVAAEAGFAISRMELKRRVGNTPPARPPQRKVTVGKRTSAKQDLLNLINPDKDAFAGKWKTENKELVSEGYRQQWRTIEIPYRPTSNYQVTLRATVSSPRDMGVSMGLIYGDTQPIPFTATLNPTDSQFSGFTMLRSPRSRLTSGNLRQIDANPLQEETTELTLVYVVQNNQTWFTCNGQLVALMPSNAEYCRIDPSSAIPSPDRMFLSCRGARFTVHQFELETLKKPLPVPTR